MNKYLLCYAVATTALLIAGLRNRQAEIRRLTENGRALTQRIEHYRTRLGEEAASVQALRLRCAEFEELRADDAERIRSMGIRLRRLESEAAAATSTIVEVKVPVRDTIVVHDTLQLFRWHDDWVTVEGLVAADSVTCRVESVDTLRQVVHRIPRRFLFFRFGTKALRQEIVSSNPHSKIIYTEYVRIEK